MEGDQEYFSRRSREEREAAMKAGHPGARQSHMELAQRYGELAEAIGSHERPPSVSGAVNA
jgi:hypothetical protein